VTYFKTFVREGRDRKGAENADGFAAVAQKLLKMRTFCCGKCSGLI